MGRGRGILGLVAHGWPWLPRGGATALRGGATELMGDVVVLVLSERHKKERQRRAEVERGERGGERTKGTEGE